MKNTKTKQKSYLITRDENNYKKYIHSNIWIILVSSSSTTLLSSFLTTLTLTPSILLSFRSSPSLYFLSLPSLPLLPSSSSTFSSSSLLPDEEAITRIEAKHQQSASISICSINGAGSPLHLFSSSLSVLIESVWISEYVPRLLPFSHPPPPPPPPSPCLPPPPSPLLFFSSPNVHSLNEIGKHDQYRFRVNLILFTMPSSRGKRSERTE